MKKLILSSVFPEDDGMFFHNKVFRILHRFLRETEQSILLGMAKNEFGKVDHGALFFYADKKVLDQFCAVPDMVKILERNIYDQCIEDVAEQEPVLMRVSNYNPVKKAKARHQYWIQKFGEIDPAIAKQKANLQTLIQYYRNKQSAEREVYFLAHKNGKQLGIHAQAQLANPRELTSNSYGLSQRF
ncbi:hypothetical protein [Thiomicrorhabdus indica]|uniref:hypothetical protein n=1 Tax=Thiomicrorhabdus indica TaxID=2267253 RepID=UPI00102D6D11|nr:hypothetical protein [Thiomicrorhabdus indica]